MLLEPEGTGCRLPEFRFLPDDDGRVRAPGLRAAAAKIDRLRAELRQTRLDYAALEAVITASTTGLAPRSVFSRPRMPYDNSRTECPTFRSGINAHFGTLIALARCSETYLL